MSQVTLIMLIFREGATADDFGEEEEEEEEEEQVVTLAACH